MHDIREVRARANTGDSDAQLLVAYNILTGNAAETVPGEMAYLVNAACEKRNANAFLLNATLAAFGLGRPKKIEDAYNFIREAAALGNKQARDQLKILGVKAFDRDSFFTPIHLTPLRESPRIAFAENFLSPAVCDWFIKRGKEKLSRSQVNDPTGAGVISASRTSSAATFSVLEGDLVLLLACRRVASATNTPLLHQEATTLLHYAPGQEYLPHYDFLKTWGEEGQNYAGEIAQFGQRDVTVLVYLNDDYEGGETEFPKLNLRYRGKKGDALLFWNLSEQGALEMESLHAGLPVTKGEKWLLSKWIRQKPLPLG